VNVVLKAGILATRFLDGARWSEANLSSDTGEKDLGAFVEAFKQALKAAAEAPTG
jgi:hypothetical protein